jgi:nucleoside-diphosphate-sugar epimerase
MRWLTDHIATGAFLEVVNSNQEQGVSIFDVRDLVDKIGNDPIYIRTKIDEALELLGKGQRIIICCDYGMSRSNSIAVGVISVWNKIKFSEALEIVKSKIDGSGVKIEMLNAVYDSLALNDKKKNTNSISKILLTGSSGFIGTKLKTDLSKSAEIFTPSSKEINLVDNIIELDMYVKMHDIDTIVHLANPKIFTTNKSVGDSLVMLKNVLDVCRSNKVKIIYLSGWEIYSGYKSSGLLANEQLQAYPKGTYGETKWFCELLIKQYAEIYGVKYQIIRSGPVYGPGSEKPRFIYNFIHKARKGEGIQTHQYLNGSPILDLLFINDLISILVKVIDSDFEGELNIGSKTGASTFEIAQLICELTNSSSEIRQVDIHDHSSNIIMDNSLASSLFHWVPEVDLKRGIHEILNHQ